MPVTKVTLFTTDGEPITLQGDDLTTADVLDALHAPAAEDDTAELAPLTPAMLAAMDAEQAVDPAIDFRLEAPVLFDLIADLVSQVVPGHEDQIALTARVAAAVGGYLHDLKVELTSAWSTVDELHRQRETLARQLDAVADRAAY